MEIIHYVFQTEPERVACMPEKDKLYSIGNLPPVMRSADPNAVTCPECKKTDHYKARQK